MAQTLNITDGTTTVSLVNASGFFVRGWDPGIGAPRILSSYSSLYDGNKLQSVKRDNVRETLTVKLKGSTQDNAAAQLQVLQQLLRKAALYHTSARHTTPVYLTAKADSESNTRYSLLYTGYLKSPTSAHEPLFTRDFVINNMTLYIEREPYWRSHAPGTLSTALALVNAENAAANGTRQLVGNFYGEVPLSHVYAYDNSETAFSANLVASSSYNHFEVSGSTPAVNDIMYFGSNTKAFHTLVLNLSASYTADGFVDAQYYNGSWVDINAAFGGSFPYQVGGASRVYVDGYGNPRSVTIGAKDDFATVAINSVTAYWIRLQLRDTPTGTATQATVPAYTLKHNYIEIPATTIDGDSPPKMMIALRGAGTTSASNPSMMKLSRIYMGAKSRGLTNFQSCWGFNNQANGDFTVGAGTDGTITDDAEAPGGQSLRISFATTETKALRVALDDSQIEDYIGKYRCFLRAQQIGGSAGDCTVSIRFVVEYAASVQEASVYETATKAFVSTDSNAELIDFGIVNIPSTGINTGDTLDNADNTLKIGVYATRSTGAGVLRLYDVVLLPIDEWSCVLNDPIQDTSVTATCFMTNRTLQFDSGVLAKRTSITITPIDDGTIPSHFPLADWELRGVYPDLLPDRQYRIYVLMAYYNGTFGTLPFLSSAGSIACCEIYAHEQWELLRGAE